MKSSVAAPPVEDVDTRDKTRRQPPYAVLLHNNEHNSMAFVCEVLMKVFRYQPEKCVQLMMEAHDKGQAVIWSGMREVAELKADQVHSAGPEPGCSVQVPLQCSVEPMA